MTLTKISKSIQVKNHGPRDIKIRITAPQDRLFSTFNGGSILAGLDTFRNMMLTKKQYDDAGKPFIHRSAY